MTAWRDRSCGVEYWSADERSPFLRFYSALPLLHRCLDRGNRFVQGFGRADLQQLAALRRGRHVTRRHVERVAGLEHFFPIRVGHRDLAPEDVAPVRAPAASLR